MYHKAGYPGFVARLQERGPEYVNAVNWMSYQMAPRAQIFRRDSSNVTDFESLKSVMRYNRYKDDPVSAASDAICPSMILSCSVNQQTDFYIMWRSHSHPFASQPSFGKLLLVHVHGRSACNMQRVPGPQAASSYPVL